MQGRCSRYFMVKLPKSEQTKTIQKGDLICTKLGKKGV